MAANQPQTLPPFAEYGLEYQDKSNPADAHNKQYFRGYLVDGVHPDKRV
jgi:hypothetical protein